VGVVGKSALTAEITSQKYGIKPYNVSPRI